MKENTKVFRGLFPHLAGWDNEINLPVNSKSLHRLCNPCKLLSLSRDCTFEILLKCNKMAGKVYSASQAETG
jgi:hypothetical protein